MPECMSHARHLSRRPKFFLLDLDCSASYLTLNDNMNEFNACPTTHFCIFVKVAYCPLTFMVCSLAVCQFPPSVGDTLTVYVDNANGVPTCIMSRCPNGDWRCPCSNIFPTTCGSLNGSVTLEINLQNVLDVPSYLQVIGISDIQTITNNIVLSFYSPNTTNVSYALNVFPKLQVLRGVLYIRTRNDNRSSVLFLPGSGLGSLLAVGQINLQDFSNLIQNTNMTFFSSGILCAGKIGLEGLSTLTSLVGFDRIVDGVALPPYNNNWIYNLDSAATLTNVSALAAYARCGPNQRPDGVGSPALGVPCGNLFSWSAYCRYITFGTC